MSFSFRSMLVVTTLLSVIPAFAQDKAPAPAEPGVLDKMKGVLNLSGSPMANLDADMQRVIDAFAALGPKPLAPDLSPEEARQQPTVADAAKKVMRDSGMSDAPEPGVTTEDVTYEGAAGPVKARIYKPENTNGQLPVVLYFHGGGWVIADIDVYDAAPRSIAKQAGAIVVSAHYRQAPENRFPAAHNDAIAAYKWVLAKAQSWGGDSAKVAVLGESAGGNLAINVAIAARDQNLQMPVHQGLVYPVAGSDVTTESYEANQSSMPLNKAGMQWFVKHVFADKSEAKDPRIDLVGAADLKGLPPVTIITAGIDPLRTEGQLLAANLKKAGVTVNLKDYPGSTHEFFGLAALVDDAKDAQKAVIDDLKAAFGASEGRASGTMAK